MDAAVVVYVVILAAGGIYGFLKAGMYLHHTMGIKFTSQAIQRPCWKIAQQLA